MKHVFILMAFVSNFFLMVGQQNGSIENVISNTHDKHIQIIPFIPPIDSSKYATIYVYRRGKSLASLASFDIHFDGGIVCKMKNKSKFEFRVFTEGPLYYWMGYKYLGGKDDEQYKSKNIQRLDVKFGESYYVECVYIVSGGIMGVPVIRNVLNEEGNKNYVKISKINEYKYIPELEAGVNGICPPVFSEKSGGDTIFRVCTTKLYKNVSLRHRIKDKINI